MFCPNDKTEININIKNIKIQQICLLREKCPSPLVSCHCCRWFPVAKHSHFPPFSTLWRVSCYCCPWFLFAATSPFSTLWGVSYYCCPLISSRKKMAAISPPPSSPHCEECPAIVAADLQYGSKKMASTPPFPAFFTLWRVSCHCYRWFPVAKQNGGPLPSPHCDGARSLWTKVTINKCSLA